MKLSKFTTLLLVLSLLSNQSLAVTNSDNTTSGTATGTVTNQMASPTLSTAATQTTSTSASTTNTAVTDAQIVAQIHAKMAADKVVAHSNVMATSQNGVVKLVGDVPTDTEASRVVEIANSTPGVKSTDESQLTVKKSQHPMSDMMITAKVKGSFVREKLFGDHDVSPMSIKVETKNGVVYLTGTTDTQEKVNNAIKIAEAVSGVKRVESKVEVKKG